MRTRRVVAAGAAVALLGPIALLIPAHAAEPSAGPVASAASAKPRALKAPALKASVNPAVPGERITFVAKAPTSKKFRKLKASKKRAATIVLQRRDGSTWRDVAKKKLGKRSSVSLASSVPSAAKGTVKYRVRAKVGKTWYTGGSLSLRTVAQKLKMTPSTTDADRDARYVGQLTPVRAGRTVTVERYLDGAWSTVGKTTAAKADVALAVAAVRYPAWYRVKAAARNGIPAVTSAPVRSALTRTPTEVAHRAGAALAPEQTFAALDASLAAGATAMEIDVQLTKDGVPIIVHDATFARTTDVATVFPGRENQPVGEFTWAEVEQLDAGRWFGAQWAGQKIPTLNGWLGRLDGRARLVLEVKFHPNNEGTPSQVEALRKVLDAELAGGPLGQLAAQGKLTVSSFNHTFLKPFALAHPEVPVGALALQIPSGDELSQWATWADEAHTHFQLTSADRTAAARAAGLSTSLWTVVAASDYRTAVAAGADSLITDRPGLLAEVLSPPAP